MNQILLWLGLNTTGFKAGLKDVKDQTKELKAEWKGLKDLMFIAGPALAMLGFFRSMIEHAREAKGAIDENTQAVRNLGEGWDAIVVGSKNYGVQALGFLGRMGEKLVDINRYLYMGAEAIRQEDAALRDSEEGLKRRLAMEIESNKHKAEFLKITQQLKANQEKEAELAYKVLTVSEAFGKTYIGLLEAKRELNELSRGELSMTEFNLQHRQLELKVSEAQLKFDQARTAVIKDQQDINAKGFEADLKWVKEQDAAAKKHREYLLEQKSLSEQITALEAEKAKLTKEAVGDSVKQVQVDEISVQIAEKKVDLAQQEAAALAAARKQAEGMAEAQRRNYEVYTKFMNLAVLGGHSSEQIQRSSDDALKELLQRNRAEAFRLNLADPGGPMHFGNSLEVTRLENENRRIQYELDTRNDIRDSVSGFGLDTARRNYKGDPLIFDDLVDQFTRTQDRTDKVITGIEDLVKQFSSQSGQQNNIASQLTKLTSATQAVATILNTRGVPTG